MTFILYCILLPIAVGALIEAILYFVTRRLKRRFALPLRLIPAYIAVLIAAYGFIKYFDILRDGTWHELAGVLLWTTAAAFALGGALGFCISVLMARKKSTATKATPDSKYAV